MKLLLLPLGLLTVFLALVCGPQLPLGGEAQPIEWRLEYHTNAETGWVEEWWIPQGL